MKETTLAVLAAGMGKRLKELTSDNTKCMVKVNGVTLIERMLRQLDELWLRLDDLVILLSHHPRRHCDLCRPHVHGPLDHPHVDRRRSGFHCGRNEDHDYRHHVGCHDLSSAS